MSAVRVARAATRRDLIIKFEGCYHGHADGFLVKAGSGALTLGVPTSPGVPPAIADLTLTLPYNDLNAVLDCLAARGEAIAAIIVEPVAGNMNCIPPVEGYLEGLRSACDEHGCLLIFDEVMTGFRVCTARCTGSVWNHPRPVHFRKSDRWRDAGRCFRRQARIHGDGRPQRAGVPGRYAFG